MVYEGEEELVVALGAVSQVGVLIVEELDRK